ncbi:ABC transporter permease [Leeuwenhoekiella polynyae]|uniref:ABC-type antimicrobial peptide transport system permease subunit n=1 Tax=Leeuwenhoekiella polynyae TaxID=1550906 RepID=A0A4Q0P4A1_9FLAO|nr:ABC transporter permease [Leeuwenhoekiella polynyae]RXG20389.1 ABC-type antimicrobial peptide transport system permease subunit [Leeuwenhoekiella polynyae]
MFKNYINIAFRNLLKHKGYSAINIFGLALGMAVTLMIGLWVADEVNFNSYFENKPRLAQVYQSQTFNGKTQTGPAIPRPLEFALRENFESKFKYLSMASWSKSRNFNYKETAISLDGYSVQPEFTQMINLKIIQGDAAALKSSNAIMLSQTAAKTMFGAGNAMGKIIKVNDVDHMIVSAIYEDIPEGNDFKDMEYLMPWSLYAKKDWIESSIDQWGNNSFQLFVELADGVDLASASAAITSVKKESDAEVAPFNPQLFLFPMREWHLHSNFEDGVQTGGRIENVWLFGIIGAFVLLLACINFMNLATARSEKRVIEVGIRKTIGSTKNQLIKQFLTESFLVVIMACILALAITLVFLKPFNTLADKAITFPWSNLVFWVVILLFIAFTALVSGSYPALYLSSFRPIKVLKGTFKVGKLATLPRKILVVTQFSVSAALIIGTLIVMSQIDFSKNRPTGYTTENLIQIPVMSNQFLGKHDMMRNQFKKSGAVLEMATSSSPTTEVWSNQSGYGWEGKPEGFQEDLAYTQISYEYVETLKIKMAAGRGFSREFPTDSTAVILNESAVAYMGLQDPVGKYLTQGSNEGGMRKLQIIGVMKDMVVQSPYEPVKQAIYMFDGFNNASYWNLRLNPENSMRENLATVEKVFKEHFPNALFHYDFIDQEYAKKFAEEDRIASLAKVFTALAIVISCLGLFGLASFVAEQRTKEIGVRKVLGASVANLWMLLSKDFLVLVFIALLIAAPVSYYLMHNWVQKFTYHTEISIWIFIAAGAGALGITLFTVSFQALKAAFANPVKSLRTQ